MQWTQKKIRSQVAQVVQLFGGGKHPRGMSELNPCLPSFRRPPASLGRVSDVTVTSPSRKRHPATTTQTPPRRGHTPIRMPAGYLHELVDLLLLFGWENVLGQGTPPRTTHTRLRQQGSAGQMCAHRGTGLRTRASVIFSGVPFSAPCSQQVSFLARPRHNSHTPHLSHTTSATPQRADLTARRVRLREGPYALPTRVCPLTPPHGTCYPS